MERGRLAPSPSGRMHLGNLFAFYMAWRDVRQVGGQLVLRMEDLDVTRCKPEYLQQLADDLTWLGLQWDEGWGKGGQHQPYDQRSATHLYEEAFQKLESLDLVYPCFCTREERLAVSAPHLGEHQGHKPCPCRHLTVKERDERSLLRQPAWKAKAPDLVVTHHDHFCGVQTVNLAHDCGDFILRRSDGVYAYQLAVAVDDGRMGITRVIRGRDLLSSTPWQIWLLKTLGYQVPTYGHVPLLLAPDGRRLAKRDKDLDMATLRKRYTPEELRHWLQQLTQQSGDIKIL